MATRPGAVGGDASAPAVRDALALPGQPLPDGVRAGFERRLGADLGAVRVHADARAAHSARVAGATAYTVGQRIAFAQGRYAPHTPDGARLLAHELTHVVQQSRPSVGASASAAEAEARRNARAWPGGGALTTAVAGRPPGGMARDEDKQEDADVTRLLALADKARDPANPRRAISHVEFVYVALRKYFPSYHDRVASVGFDDTISELKVTLLPPNQTHFTVMAGRDYLLNTTKDNLMWRVGQLGRAVSDVLEPGQAKTEKAPGPAGSAPAGSGPPLSFDDALKEGAQVLQAAGFGKVCGTGPDNQADADDRYDAREWKEMEGHHEMLVATVEPWLAFAHLIQNLGKPVPSSTGGSTTWAVDCFGHVTMTRIYAHWRTLDRTTFNARYNPLTLGINSLVNAEWGPAIRQDKPGGPRYIEQEAKIDFSGGPMKWPKKAVAKTWEKILEEAPVGSQVIWSNQDVIDKCQKGTVTGGLCNWKHENTTKLGPDSYSAHNLGIHSRAEIEDAFAAMVLGAGATAAEKKAYIRKFVFIDAVRAPKPVSA